MNSKRKVILVTGASTGIGYETAIQLAADGNIVYAGARKAEDIKRLSFVENITGIQLDITKLEDINNAVSLILKREGHVDVLINNAGVTGWGAIMDREMSYFRNVLEINYFGHVQMIQAFYPLLKKSTNNPIIINISSQAGNYAMPFWSAYHSSKWAMEAFSHCLRRELKPYGIRVSIIQPGAIKSDAFIKDTTAFEDYKQIKNSDFVKYAVPVLEASFHRSPISKEKTPLLVVRDIRHAIYSKKARIYYQPGRRLIPDLLFAKLSYKQIDRIVAKLLKKSDAACESH